VGRGVGNRVGIKVGTGSVGCVVGIFVGMGVGTGVGAWVKIGAGVEDQTTGGIVITGIGVADGIAAGNAMVPI
jgi:hypothetical protein